MKRRMFVLGTIVFCFAVSGASAADVFSGNWKVNLAKSKYDPGPPRQVEVRSGSAAEGAQHE